LIKIPLNSVLYLMIHWLVSGWEDVFWRWRRQVTVYTWKWMERTWNYWYKLSSSSFNR